MASALGPLRATYRGTSSNVIRIGLPLLVLSLVPLYFAISGTLSPASATRGDMGSAWLCALVPFLGGLLLTVLALRHRRKRLELYQRGFVYRAPGEETIVAFEEIARTDLREVRTRRGALNFCFLVVELKDGRKLDFRSIARLEYIAQHLESGVRLARAAPAASK